VSRLASWLVALCLGVAGIAVHAACPESGGIGGTGKPSSGGMGGSGAPGRAELGLVGVVQAAGGAICVNGVEVQMDAATRVTADNMPVAPTALAPGQVVVVNGSGTAETTHASQIDILHAVTGPVSAFDASNGVLHIGAQRVHVSEGTLMAGMSRSSLGERPAVRVSGLWRADGSVEATRIERAPRGASASVASRDFPALGARRLIVDGFVRSIERTRVNVGGLSFEADARTLAGLRRDERVRLHARAEAGRRIIERVEPVRASTRGPAPRLADPDARSERRDAPGDDRGAGPGAGPERSIGAERIERSGPDRPERVERNSGPDRPERVERNSGPDRPERVERNSGPDRPERVDRSGSDRPERTEQSGRH
jgi:Domain of unknown function (DUF5666)